MRTLLPPLLGATLLATACSQRPNGNPEHTASAYTSTDTSGAQAREGTPTGTQLEAPPKISGILTALDYLSRQSLKEFNANATAHKNQLTGTVASMRSDLARLGQADTGAFKALADSVTEDLGGGTGEAKKLTEPERKAHIARVRRLIEMYQKANPSPR
jgi:hypothetical protein